MFPPLSIALYINGIFFKQMVGNYKKRKENYGNTNRVGRERNNHSQFSDETLFLSGTSTILPHRFKYILKVFMRASGGKTNKKKIQIYLWNTNQRIETTISRI